MCGETAGLVTGFIPRREPGVPMTKNVRKEMVTDLAIRIGGEMVEGKGV